MRNVHNKLQMLRYIVLKAFNSEQALVQNTYNNLLKHPLSTVSYEQDCLHNTRQGTNTPVKYSRLY